MQLGMIDNGRMGASTCGFDPPQEGHFVRMAPNGWWTIDLTAYAMLKTAESTP